MSEKTIKKTGSVKEMDKRLQSPEAKKRLFKKLVAHLTLVGQIPDPKMTEKELEEFFEIDQTKEVSKEYLKRPASELQKELEEYQRKQTETAEAKFSKELSPAGKKALLEYARKTGLIKGH